MINMMLVHRQLKTMQYRIETDAAMDSCKSLLFKFSQQTLLVKIMKGIHDLVCKPDKSIDIADRRTKILMQQPDRRRKRSAVNLCDLCTAKLAGLVKKMKHSFLFSD